MSGFDFVARGLALKPIAAIADIFAARSTAVQSAVSAAASQQSVAQMIAAINLPAAFYATHAAAVADTANIAANATVSVIADEDQSGYYTLYKKLIGVLVYQGSILPPLFFQRCDLTDAPMRSRVIVHAGTSRVQGLPSTRTAYETLLFGPGGPYEGAKPINLGANGATMAGVVANIATGNQAEQPYDYYPTNTVPPAPNASGTSNPYATVNADPDEVWPEYGTNDIRVSYTTGGSSQAGFRTSLNKYNLFLLMRTRAKLTYFIPAPLAYANPDPNGFTDCTSADDAALRSAEMRQVHLELAALPSNRVLVVDTHKHLYGYRYDSVAAAVDPEGAGLSLTQDTLHNSALGDWRLYQMRARMKDPSLPATASHFNLPKTVTDVAKWGRTFRWRGGVNGALYIDNYAPRKRNDISTSGDNGAATQNGNVAVLRAHQDADNLIHAGVVTDIGDLEYLSQCFVYFPKTNITMGPVNLGPGTDQPANGYRSFNTAGDWTVTNSGITAADLISHTAQDVFIFVKERRYMPGFGETQVPLVIQVNGAQPMAAISATANVTVNTNDLVVTANTGAPFPVGSTVAISIAGLPTNAYIQSVPVDGTGRPTQTGTYKLSANFTGTTTAGVTVTSQPWGASKPAREIGRPYTVVGARGQRDDMTGAAVIDVYAQTSNVGANGATPFPGLRVGTLTFNSTERSAPIANWAPDLTNYPLVTFPNGPRTTAQPHGTYAAFLTSGRVGRFCSISLLFGEG